MQKWLKNILWSSEVELVKAMIENYILHVDSSILWTNHFFFILKMWNEIWE